MSNSNVPTQDYAYPNPWEFRDHGLTKRELFAAMAMQGLCADGDTIPDEIPMRSVKMADDLIAVLNK